MKFFATAPFFSSATTSIEARSTGTPRAISWVSTPIGTASDPSPPASRIARSVSGPTPLLMASAAACSSCSLAPGLSASFAVRMRSASVRTRRPVTSKTWIVTRPSSVPFVNWIRVVGFIGFG